MSFRVFVQLINYWKDFVKSYRTVASFRWLVIGVLVGILSGLVAVAFFWLVEFGKFFIQHHLAGIVAPGPGGRRHLRRTGRGISSLDHPDLHYGHSPAHRLARKNVHSRDHERRNRRNRCDHQRLS